MKWGSPCSNDQHCFTGRVPLLYIPVCTHTHTYTHTYVCIHTHICTHTSVCLLYQACNKKNPQSTALWSSCVTMNKSLPLWSVENRYSNPCLPPSQLGVRSARLISGSTLGTEKSVYTGVTIETVGNFPLGLPPHDSVLASSVGFARASAVWGSRTASGKAPAGCSEGAARLHPPPPCRAPRGADRRYSSQLREQQNPGTSSRPVLPAACLRLPGS